MHPGAKIIDRKAVKDVAKIMIIASLGQSLIRFRGDLIDTWLEKGHQVLAVAPDNDVREQLELKGVKFFSIPFERAGINPLKDLKLLWQLIKLLRHNKPDYLFSYTAKPVIYGSLASFFISGCHVFAMITGLGYVFTTDGENRWLKKLSCFLYRVALIRSERVFFQNPDDLQLFYSEKLIKNDQGLLVNGSGVNLDYFGIENIPGGAPVFLMIARLLKEKGFHEYIEAAQIIKKQHPQVIFKLIAWQMEGSPSVLSADTLKKWHEKGIVEIFGETDDVRPYIAAASVYVLPSYREGTPRTVLEAMAMGRAIITTDAPGCRETVIDGLNGFLVPVKDSNALAKAMERFIAEPSLIEKMGAESRKIAAEKYDVHKVNRLINEVMGL